MPQEPAAPNGQHRKNPFIRRLNKTAQLPDKGIFHFSDKVESSWNQAGRAKQPQNPSPTAHRG
ncbi:hypothetical protein [Phocaeicola coprophilus]|uniref:hypothetical protein n=1 Tax=Phocaeicola coprophilus TaxID=387090 RepID=UPI002659CE9B|nr:hypothetical protein [Phocaeicola coprophilus]